MTRDEERHAQQRAASARYRAKHPDRVAAGKVRYRNRKNTGAFYIRTGMRPDDWAALWQAQDGRCYLCGDQLVQSLTHLDHDHRCCAAPKSCRNCWRGLACSRCNHLIGLAGDDPDRLELIAANLRQAKSEFDAQPGLVQEVLAL